MPMSKKLLLTVLCTGWLVGSLDIAAALLHYVIVTGNDAAIVLQYIASSIYGNEAFAGGEKMLVAGFVIHFGIAFFFTMLFFIIYPFVKLQARNPMITGILYGCFIWIVMNLLVLPLTRVDQGTFELLTVLTGILILIIAIGIPLSLVAKKYYGRAK